MTKQVVQLLPAGRPALTKFSNEKKEKKYIMDRWREMLLHRTRVREEKMNYCRIGTIKTFIYTIGMIPLSLSQVLACS